MSSVLSMYQKHSQKGSHLAQTTWIVVLFSGPILILCIHLRMNINLGARND